ncbi:MAG TPA: MFS transporter [Actinophytocola sp.]|uniref:MFS transporter n=1 Tax=Actinophytocola sp. TaxID=1872138 RepID=UPI002DBC371F|nr:MFS transporter [Actinophytocola sp.]HEU5475563.1 MFS transporter [Actinophytocola sp.]
MSELNVGTEASSGAAGASPPDPRRWKALALLCTASFMVILDAQIVILALPSIEAELAFAPGAAQWVLSAYLLTFGGLLLLGGRSADLLGRRRMFMIGTALFLVASLVCGLAWTSGVLIAARAVQGVSAAIMAPTALSIVLTTFDVDAERNRALGIWSGIGGIGATAALLVGGPITDWLGWEWIFFINIPVAIGLLVLSPVLLRESRATARTRSFDLAGAATITLAAVLFVYALVQAPQVGWISLPTLGLLVAGAILVDIFLRIEERSAAPLVPLRIFRSRALVGGNVAMVLLGTIAFGMPFVVSLYAQQVLGYSAIVFGLSTVIMTVMAVVGSFAGQAIVTRTGFRMVAAVGLALGAVGCLLLSRVSADGSYFGDIFFGLLVFGPGLGACYVAVSIAALTGVPEQESGLASAINTAAFQIGGAIGVAVCSTVVVASVAGADGPEALTDGFRAGFLACVILAVIGVAVALTLLRQPRRQPSGVAK